MIKTITKYHNLLKAAREILKYLEESGRIGKETYDLKKAIEAFERK